MSLSVSGFFFKWPCAPAKTLPVQNCDLRPATTKTSAPVRLKPGRRGNGAGKHSTAVDMAQDQAQDQAQARRLINHDMQHFNIRFAHALAGQTGDTADGFFHIALHNALASGKHLALHGEIVRGDGGIHRR